MGEGRDRHSRDQKHSRMKFLLAIAVASISVAYGEAHPEVLAMVNEINSAKTSWTAGVNAKFRCLQAHHTKHVYTVPCMYVMTMEYSV